MKSQDHGVGLTRHSKSRSAFEKTLHNVCPTCGKADLTVYFKSGSPNGVGAYCYSCGLTVFFTRNDFYEVGRMPPHLIPHKPRPRIAGG